jgi:TldD protein
MEKSTMPRILAIALGCLALVATTTAADKETVTLDKALEQDTLLRAMIDELDRSMTGVHLEDLEKPYFIEYAANDAYGAWATAEFGAITGRNEYHQRIFRADVRVGDYELDNTNFSGGGWGGYGGRASLPLEDDYNAIRQSIWWATDRQYKSVAETFVQKQAFMKSKLIEDKPNDFSKEEPVVYLETTIHPSFDLAPMEALANEVSAVFKEYPEVQDCGVSIGRVAGQAYLVNSEGTRLRENGRRYSFVAMVQVQADDGMELSDSFTVHARKNEDFPSADELKKRCREMTEQIIAVRDAPRVEESYAGPVLFEPAAAASLFAGRFASRFSGGQRPVGSRTSPDDFANKLNRRILPRFMNVVDDASIERIHDKPVLGHYKYDDQGVPPQRISLVEDGRLKALLMSRNPSKEYDQSTGHGRGFYSPRAAPSCMIVTAEPAATHDELVEELLEVVADEGLDYGIRIESMSGNSPLTMYRVYPDGREELVRGAQFANISLRAFKRMLAAGDEPHVLNSSGNPSTTIVAPAMLFEELDLAKIDRDFDKPPILTNPLAR